MPEETVLLNVEAIVTEIGFRGGTLNTDGWKLYVTPQGLLDDDLRAAMKASRPALIRWCRAQDAAFVKAVCKALDGHVVTGGAP